MEKIKGCKTLIVSALRREKHHSHFSLAEAVDFIENLNVNEGYLTHISHQMGKHKDVSTELPSYIKLAHDGLELEL
jgi:phosphoribosyl 1,2-cyclic phosphate phosphodiesterase